MATALVPELDHDQLDFDLQHAASVRLLKGDTAPLVLAFLFREFKRTQRMTVPYAELAEHLETYLELLAERHPGRYPRTAAAYLKQWCDEEHRWLRTYVRGGSDEPMVELTADTERAIGWIEDLRPRPFVGTESRFLTIFALLEDVVGRSTEDHQARLAQLEKQRDAIQREIDAIRETGAVARYTATQVKERFLQACDVARQLLRDFAVVEQNFRTIVRSIQQEQLKPDVHKGALVGYVLDADEQLKSSDQGRSFYAFWEFLMSPARQDELHALLDAVYGLRELRELSRDTPVLRHITRHLLDAGEKIVQTNHRLADQLRRILDERNAAESRRVRELIVEVKRAALRLAAEPPEEAPTFELEGPPAAQLVMEKEWWQPSETPSFAGLPVPPAAIDLAELDLGGLYDQFYVDESLLRARIDALLEDAPQVTLGEVVRRYPIEKGLSEVIAYLAIAAGETRHAIDAALTEHIELPTSPLEAPDLTPGPSPAGRGAPDLAPATLLTVPRVVFRSHADAY